MSLTKFVNNYLWQIVLATLTFSSVTHIAKLSYLSSVGVSSHGKSHLSVRRATLSSAAAPLTQSLPRQAFTPLSEIVAAERVETPSEKHRLQNRVALYCGSFVLLILMLGLRRKLSSQGTTAFAMCAASEDELTMLSRRSGLRQVVGNISPDGESLMVQSRGVAALSGPDEVARGVRAELARRQDLTPQDIILEVQRGNCRFWMGVSERPDATALERRALVMAQAPKLCVLSCSDSRVPVEIVLDLGLGEVFVVRMAGNILDDTAQGSIEFAVKYLGVKVVLVMGHEGCGAVKGAVALSREEISEEPYELQLVLNDIKNNLDVAQLRQITDTRAREREAIVLNTGTQVRKLKQNVLLAGKEKEGSLLIAGAFYEISSGIVDFFSLDKNGFVIDLEK